MMIGTSIWEYILIRTAIFLLRSITPISFLYCFLFFILRPERILHHRLPLPFEIWFSAEILFFLLIYLPLRFYLQRKTTHPVLETQSARQELFQKCLSHTPNTETYLRKWFLMAPWNEIKQENVVEFLAWAFLDKEMGDLKDEERKEIGEYVGCIEERLGERIEKGRGKAKCLKLSFDKVPMVHRCLVWYLLVSIIDTLTSLRLLLSSKFYRTSFSSFFTNFPFRPHVLFSRHKSPSPNLSYWYRPHTSKTKLPILFIHGIGIGLLPYVDFFKELIEKDPARGDGGDEGDVGVLILELMPISARICRPALSNEVLRKEVKKVLESVGWGEFVVVANSYGTAISANLLKDTELSKSIKRLVLIDPVSFLLFQPDVAYNFTRRPPSLANERMLHYFSSTDMMISHTLSRHFSWHEYVLWKEDLKGIPTTVHLGGRDLIVDTDAVWRYLSSDTHTDSTTSTTSMNSTRYTDNINDIETTTTSGVSHTNGALRHANGVLHPREGSIVGEAVGNETRLDTGENDCIEEERPQEWTSPDGDLQLLWFQKFDHAEIFRADRRGALRALVRATRKRCLIDSYPNGNGNRNVEA